MNRDEVIALAKKLYDGGKGISYQKIAEKFNADGIPTKTGKGSWEKKMVSRLIADDVLKKAEVKVGLKTDREVQLESEIESLKEQLNRLFEENNEFRDAFNREPELVSQLSEARCEKRDAVRERDKAIRELIESRSLLFDEMKKNAELNTVKQENEYLKSEIAGLRSDRDEALKELNTVKHRVAGFDAENQRLHRMLNEAELKYKTLYESEINRLGSELAIANQKIQELRDKQTFLKPKSESEMPVNFMGWTTCKSGDYVRMFRKFSGKMKAIYVGKEWNEDAAREKIAAFESKQKPQSELFAGTECKSCQHQPEFESRLRSVCPETVRTYRLDTVAGHFPDCDFSREMIALAEQKRIELLAGDPSQCDTSKLIQYRGRMYVNFEWR